MIDTETPTLHIDPVGLWISGRTRVTAQDFIETVSSRQYDVRLEGHGELFVDVDTLRAGPGGFELGVVMVEPQ